jgi:hypothetical protein
VGGNASGVDDGAVATIVASGQAFALIAASDVTGVVPRIMRSAVGANNSGMTASSLPLLGDCAERDRPADAPRLHHERQPRRQRVADVRRWRRGPDHSLPRGQFSPRGTGASGFIAVGGGGNDKLGLSAPRPELLSPLKGSTQRPVGRRRR